MDAEFAINVAAGMTGGGQTTAQLDEITASLLGGGKNADFFVDAMAKVSAELSAAKVEASAANEALAAGNAEFARLERASVQAAVALEKAERSGKASQVQIMMLGDSARAAAAELDQHKSALAGIEKAAQQADAKEKGLTQTLGNLKTLNGHVNKTIGEQGEGIEKLRGALSSAGGPLGKFAAGVLGPVDGFHKLSGSMGQSTAAAVIFSSVVAALTVALIAGAGALLAWGIGLSDTNRSARLTTEAMVAMHPELAALQGTIAAVGRETGMHSDELTELSGRLREARVAAADMPAALRAAALAETALGKGGAADFIADLKSGKASAAALSAEVSGKLAPIVGRQMLSIGAQTQRLKDNFAGIFGSLDIEPVLTGFSRLVGLFDKNTAAGQTLQFVFESVFGPLVAGADTAAIAVERFVLKALLWAVKGYNAFRPWVPAFEAVAVGIGAAGLAFVATFVPGAIAATAAMLPVVAATLAAAAPFLAIAAAAAAVYLAFTHWDQIVPLVAGIFGAIPEMAANLVSGLVDGIVAAGPAVLKALGGVVTSAIDAAKNLLGIHSPSAVFAAIGDNTIAGFTGAVDAGAGDVGASMTGAVAPAIDAAEQAVSGDSGQVATLRQATASPAPAPAAPAAASPDGGSGGAVTYNFYARTEDDAKALADKFLEIVRGAGLQGGSNPEPA